MLAMSTKERDRLKVLHEVEQGHLTQGGAAQQLGVTDRWVRKLLARVKKEGDGGIVHRLGGKESNRRLPGSLRSKVLKLVKAKYGDFGPTLASKYLARDDAVEVSKETLRQWLIAAGMRRRVLGLRVGALHPACDRQAPHRTLPKDAEAPRELSQ